LDEKLAKMKNLPAYSSSVPVQDDVTSITEKPENIAITITPNSDLIQSSNASFNASDEI
jgi:hypothetical protein